MEHRDYRWSSIFAWGLTLSGAALAVGGVLGMFWPHVNYSVLCVVAFAGMMAFGIGLVNCSAAGALHAIKHRKTDGGQVDWTVLLPALACCLGFAFATNIGVHMGWEIVKANAPGGARLPSAVTVDLVFYIFAFAKPAMAWIVEGRKAMDEEVRAARQAARRAEAAAQEAARADEAAKLAKATATPPKKTAAKRATAIRNAAKRAAEETRRARPQARVHDLEEARQDQPLTPEQVARAADLIIKSGQTPSVRKVAELLSVSRSRVERSWPKGVPLDGTGEVKSSAIRAA